jgi:hypothetical protein
LWYGLGSEKGEGPSPSKARTELISVEDDIRGIPVEDDIRRISVEVVSRRKSVEGDRKRILVEEDSRRKEMKKNIRISVEQDSWRTVV